MRTNAKHLAILALGTYLASGCVDDQAQPGSGAGAAGEGAEPVTVASAALSGIDGEWGFALAHLETGNYSAHRAYYANGAGGNVQIERYSQGKYRVTFANMSSYRGTVQVAAMGTDATRCKVAYWQSGPKINVYCHNTAGQLTDSRFVVQYGNHYRAWNGTDTAFLWAEQQSASTYEPSATYSYNGRGGANTIYRLATGTYYVILSGLQDGTGNAQVIAYGSGSEFCQLAGTTPYLGNTLIAVLCYDTQGQPIDTRFTLLYVSDDQGHNPIDTSYDYADKPTTASYLTNGNRSYNTITEGTLANSAGRFSTGAYWVRNRGFDPLYSSAAMVTAASGNGPRYCKLEGWGGWPAQVLIGCYDHLGRRVDTEHSQIYNYQRFTQPGSASALPEHLVHPGRTLQARDNPHLEGYADPSDLEWVRTLNLKAPEPVAISGPQVPIIRTTPAAIFDAMVRIRPGLAAPSATRVLTYGPRYVDRLPPWVDLDRRCTSVHSGGIECSQYLDARIKFYAPDIELPSSGAPVLVELVNAKGKLDGPDARVNSYELMLDPQTAVIPVHVHFMRDAKGNFPQRYQFGQKLSAAALAWEVRQMFDHSLVRDASLARQDHSASTKANLSTTPESVNEPDDRFPMPDFIWAQCGIQFRVDSVNMIDQAIGLENQLVSDADVINTAGGGSQCGDASRPVALEKELNASAEGMGLRRGIDVLLGGELSRLGSETNTVLGMACDRHIYVDAGGFEIPTTIAHEIGHILLGDKGHVFDPDNLMSPFAGWTLTPEQCAKARTHALTQR